MSPYDATHLPYADHLVNFLVAPSPSGEKLLKEIQRVICPGGSAVIQVGDGAKALAAKAGFEAISGAQGWVVFRKARPKGMDEWSQLFHGRF